MKISKSLFKNLTRCHNFLALYDMYCFKNAHHVKTINGYDVQKIHQNLDNFAEGDFEEEHEEALNIFNEMFDPETDEDLTIVTNAQMEALSDYFVLVEIYANQYLQTHFSGEFVYSSETKEQKKFSFSRNGNVYYCYLDIYNEDQNKIRVFEVKSTTMSKFYHLGAEKNKTAHYKKDRFDSIFYYGDDGFFHLLEKRGETSLGKLTNKKYQEHRAKLMDRYHSCGKYVYDLAIERYIMEQAIAEHPELGDINNIEYYLVVLNCDYEFSGDYIDGVPNYTTNANGEELFSVIDLTCITEDMQEDIALDLKKIETWSQELNIDDHSFGCHCEIKKSTQCKFANICYAKTHHPGSIMEYYHKNNAFRDPSTNDKLEVYDFLNAGLYNLLDVPRDHLPSVNNQIQYDCQLKNEIYLDKFKIKLGIDELVYPLYHLDFESFGCPLPRYYKERPYDQSVFQFSLHIEKAPGVCDKILDHDEFLAPDHQDHRRELCQHMIDLIDLSKGGKVIVYNQGFEKGRLKELANVFPDLAPQLLNIREHVYDLLVLLLSSSTFYDDIYPKNDLSVTERKKILSRFNFYDNRQIGSFSIKKILPLFSNLSYRDLEVHNGSDAVMRYSELENYTPEEYQKYYLALKKYCQQDTWAMVEILKGLRELIK